MEYIEFARKKKGRGKDKKKRKRRGRLTAGLVGAGVLAAGGAGAFALSKRNAKSPNTGGYSKPDMGVLVTPGKKMPDFGGSGKVYSTNPKGGPLSIRPTSEASMSASSSKMPKFGGSGKVYSTNPGNGALAVKGNSSLRVPGANGLAVSRGTLGSEMLQLKNTVEQGFRDTKKVASAAKNTARQTRNAFNEELSKPVARKSNNLTKIAAKLAARERALAKRLRGRG